jgi:hypothetical protein
MTPRIEHIIENGIEQKRCCKCQLYQSLDNYNKSKQSWDKLRAECKNCLTEKRMNNKEKMTEYNKQYWELTKEKQKEKSKIWRENNKEYVKQKMKEWLENNKEYKKQKDKEYRELNWEKKRERHRIWRKNDYADMKTNPERVNELQQYKLKTNIGRRIREILKQNKTTKSIDYVGCSLEELKKHLEIKFQEGMSWENYGKYSYKDKKSGWHIDHIIPCSAFNFENKIEIKACFYYLNLQPLWGNENIKKSDNYNIEDKEKYLNQIKTLFPENI